MDAAQARDQALWAYVQDVAASPNGSADELTKPAELKRTGVITEEGILSMNALSKRFKAFRVCQELLRQSVSTT